MSDLPSDVDAATRSAGGVAQGSGAPARTSYRHGDLRNALIDAGVELAAAGGPSAVVLREATRRAGVSPNAAYRHFADRDALLAAVSVRCLGRVAAEMGVELDALHGGGGSPAAELDAVGRAYVHFALREPGLFRTAFGVHVDPDPGRGAEQGGPGPYGRLVDVLDRAVAAGVLPGDRRLGAEAVAWSAVHGLAVLLLDGPLRSVPAEQREALLEKLLLAVREGLFARPE
jgi:AcrR family transcriptional regulator